MGGIHLRTIVLLALVLALAAPIRADSPCYTTSVSDDAQTVVELPAPGLVYGTGPDYVVVDHGTYLGAWYYEESNGIPGLQREDDAHNDVAGCDGSVASDAMAPF